MSITIENVVTVPHVDFDELVERELRDQATAAEKEYLLEHRGEWRTALLILKKKSEVQFTACKARRYAATQRYTTARLDPNYTQGQLDALWSETTQTLRKEQDWKHKANFFLFNIETRLYALSS